MGNTQRSIYVYYTLYIYIHTYAEVGVNGLMRTNGDKINVEIAVLKAQSIRCFCFILFSYFVSLFSSLILLQFSNHFWPII